MDLKKLKSFIKFMDQNNLSELEIEENKQRIRLKKYEGQKPQISYQQLPDKGEKKEKKQKDESLTEIKSPMVGTFYRAPSPEAKPFTEVGNTVGADDIVCIIEAMKVMNEIKAEVGGQIAKILPEDGQPVEFGQTLFTIKT
ncbi:MAG: acetyl-CoA carboxylase biotin carboxyl carrier protein [Candidatus Omnitrophica bacterium]|nr:acetyl-CoA carboxylase biotin carboxyl carrier protein [Candidatus Omnitrophota bacterium]